MILKRSNEWNMYVAFEIKSREDLVMVFEHELDPELMDRNIALTFVDDNDETKFVHMTLQQARSVYAQTQKVKTSFFIGCKLKFHFGNDDGEIVTHTLRLSSREKKKFLETLARFIKELESRETPVYE